jgi:glycosyltransferase involved in cell wall biosynthesis
MELLSVVIITLNEEGAIGRCIDSVSKVADEVLVIDSGSADATVHEAESRGAKVIYKEWPGFGRQKQFAVNEAAHPMVLCLDADEWLSEALSEEILKIKNATMADAYVLPRRNLFLGRWLSYGEGYPDYTLRLFNREKARWSEEPVHEGVLYDAKPIRLKGDLMHQSADNLHRFLEKQNRYTTIQAEYFYEKGKRFSLAKMILSPAVRFIRYYFLKLGFLDGVPGLIHILIGCRNAAVKQYKLYAIQQHHKSH